MWANLNETGYAEIRADLKRFSLHPVTTHVVYSYAADAEQSLANSGGIDGTYEIRGWHSKSGNPVSLDVSRAGWDWDEVPE